MNCRWVVGLMLAGVVYCAAQEAPPDGQARARNRAAAPTVEVGPIRVIAANATAQRAVVMSHEPHRISTTTINLTVNANPDVIVSSLTDLNIDTLLDQTGKPVKGDVRRFNNEIRLDANRATLSIDMSDVPAEVTDISQLVCTFNAQVAKPELIEVTDLRPNHTVTRDTAAGDTISVAYKTTPEGFSVEMHADLKNPDVKSARALSSAPFRVLDASGRQFNSMSGSGNTLPGHVDRTFNFRTGQGTQNVSLGAPAKVVVAVPTAITPVPVKVEFKNLALP